MEQTSVTKDVDDHNQTCDDRLPNVVANVNDDHEYDSTWDELPYYVIDSDHDEDQTRQSNHVYEYYSTSSDEYEDSDYEDYQTHKSFEQDYICFPLSHINKSHLENGNRIIMPNSALDRLVSIRAKYPMLFEIKNASSWGRVSHCGVLEFSGDEGFVYLPNWMMKNMELKEGEVVSLKNAFLPIGTYMKIQPHTMNFTTLSDPKAVLETTLRDFSCVTAGDTIMISHCHNQYYIDIVETKPNNAICIVETDCEVDFAPPLDYKEPEKKLKTVITSELAAQEEEPKFKPFTGVSRRLDGQTSMVLKDENADDHSETNVATELKFRPPEHSGKVVFGRDRTFKHLQKSTTKSPKEDVKEESLKNEEHKFQPFTGKKYTLRS